MTLYRHMQLKEQTCSLCILSTHEVEGTSLEQKDCLLRSPKSFHSRIIVSGSPRYINGLLHPPCLNPRERSSIHSPGVPHAPIHFRNLTNSKIDKLVPSCHQWEHIPGDNQEQQNLTKELLGWL